jgi:hypothetical protein
MLGAMSAIDRPTAAQTDSDRLSPRVPSTAMSSSLTGFVPHSVPPALARRKGQKVRNIDQARRLRVPLVVTVVWP